MESIIEVCGTILKKTAWICKYGGRALGCSLVFFFVTLVIVLAYSAFFDVTKIYYLYTRSLTLAAVLSIVNLWILFNGLFNYLMAFMATPGRSIDYDSLKPPAVQDESASELATLNGQNNEKKPKICKKCKYIKPQRSHHCAICDACVFKMDHHCPWINNCVGHFNHRYFLLMCFYVFLGSFIFAVESLHIVWSEKFEPYRHSVSILFEYAQVLSITVCLMMLFFNLWNWFLAFRGETTVEFWGKKLDNDNSRGVQYDFSLKDKWRNLGVIFGTRSVWKMLLPSVRKLYFNGIDWNTEDIQVTVKK